MKTFAHTLTSLAVLLLAQAVAAQAPTAEALLRQTFTAFQEKDSAAFAALYPNEKQFFFLVKAMLRSDFAQRNEKVDVDSLLRTPAFTDPKIWQATQKSYADDFRRILAAGEKKGIRWSEAKWTAYTVDSSVGPEAPSLYEAGLRKAGLKSVRGTVAFSVGDSSFLLPYFGLIFLPQEGGWFNGVFTGVQRKGETASQADEIEVREVTLERIENDEPPPPPPSKQKAAKSKPSSKPKKKNQTTLNP